MSSEYQCRRTALSTPGTEAPTLSSLHPPPLCVYNSSVASLLSWGPDTCPFPPLSHVHTSFSQNSDCRLLIWPVPFPITVVPLPFQLQSWFVFTFCLLPSLCVLGWQKGAYQTLKQIHLVTPNQQCESYFKHIITFIYYLDLFSEPSNLTYE